MKFKEIGFVVALILFTVINIRSNQLATNNINASLEPLTEYLVDVEKGGDKTVVVLLSGGAYVNNKPTLFSDAIPLEIAKRELKRAGYSIITLNTPCSIRCIDEYTELALLIAELEADAVIYKGIHSDFGTDTFNTILNNFNIPIYSYGSEVVLDYVLYTGPNNEGMARAVSNTLKQEATEGETVVYIETITNLNNNVLDNGYQRIEAVRKELTSIGLIEVDSVATLWSKARTFEEISRVLLEKGEVDYIIAPSIETAEGAAEAVERLGFNNIKIIAMDFTEEGVQLLQDGKIYGLVKQGLTDQGLTLADSIIAGKQGVKIKVLHSGDYIITLKNLKNFELTEGNYRW